jgi:Family of unknown function (DUF6496)
MTTRKYSTGAIESSASEPHRQEPGAAASEKDRIEQRKRTIAKGLSETRERGERVLKEMAERHLKERRSD